MLDWKYDCSCFQGIEQLKKEERRWAKKTKWMNMKAVFGHPFSLGWASPFATPDQGKADPYQYVVWRTLSSIATQTQTASQHHRPIRSHECLNRKSNTTTLKLFFLMSQVKWLNIAEKKKKLLMVFIFEKIILSIFRWPKLLSFFPYLKSLLWPLVSSLLSVWHD